MTINLIIKLLLAHLLSDFIFQSQRMSDHKESKRINIDHIYHVFVVGFTSYALSLDIRFWKYAIILALSHFLIDYLKNILQFTTKKNNLFFIDQFIHILTIIIISFSYAHFEEINFIYNIELKTLVIITSFVLCAKPANIIIKHLFKAYNIQLNDSSINDNQEYSLPNAGRLIGITERYLTLALVILGQYAAVGLIVAAKSILRYNATQTREYVLAGTLLSFSIAILNGVIINVL